MKRFLDLLVVLLSAPLWLFAGAVTALAVRVALGPVFIRQARAV